MKTIKHFKDYLKEWRFIKYSDRESNRIYLKIESESLDFKAYAMNKALKSLGRDLAKTLRLDDIVNKINGILK